MKIQAIKRELIEWLSELDDKNLLNTLHSVKKASESYDWWDELTSEQKKSVERGERDHKKGRILTSRQLWKKYEKKV